MPSARGERRNLVDITSVQWPASNRKTWPASADPQWDRRRRGPAGFDQFTRGQSRILASPRRKTRRRGPVRRRTRVAGTRKGLIISPSWRNSGEPCSADVPHYLAGQSEDQAFDPGRLSRRGCAVDAGTVGRSTARPAGEVLLPPARVLELVLQQAHAHAERVSCRAIIGRMISIGACSTSCFTAWPGMPLTFLGRRLSFRSARSSVAPTKCTSSLSCATACAGDVWVEGSRRYQAFD
jgi:hypothetical protein